MDKFDQTILTAIIIGIFAGFLAGFCIGVVTTLLAEGCI